MNKGTIIQGKANTPNGEDEMSIAKLLNLAGPRASISPAIERRVHAKVYDEWLHSSRAARGFRRAIPFALAASILVAVVIGLRAPEVSMQPIGSVARVTGAAPANGPVVTVGELIYAGEDISTGTQGLSLRLNNGVSVRINAESQLSFENANELTLKSGMLYADTGQSIYNSRHIVVHTPAATTTDIGTQFMVSYRDDEMSVAVREGTVDVAHQDNNYTAIAGEKLTVTPRDDVRTAEISTSDGSWAWAEALAPDFEIENRSLLDFLKWFVRETGRELQFSSNEVRMSAMRTKLHGSISDMTPLEAAQSVLSTSGFQYRIDPESVHID